MNIHIILILYEIIKNPTHLSRIKTELNWNLVETEIHFNFIFKWKWIETWGNWIEIQIEVEGKSKLNSN